jgi:putative hydrolase of HD superfamily
MIALVPPFPRILEFMDYFCRLKETKRAGWVSKLNLRESESVSDHTLSMVILALLLAELNNYPLSKTLKIIKMILIHDLAESVIGDLTPESDLAKEKVFMEDKAMEKILSEFPSAPMGNKFRKLWREYVKNETFESQFVHLIDKIDMVIQAKFYVKTNRKISKGQIKPFLESALEYSTRMNNASKDRTITSGNENKDMATIEIGDKENDLKQDSKYSSFKTQAKDLEYLKKILIQLCK